MVLTRPAVRRISHSIAVKVEIPSPGRGETGLSLLAEEGPQQKGREYGTEQLRHDVGIGDPAP